jgi:nicotinic acid mononucleotide adenylyltransferase
MIRANTDPEARPVDDAVAWLLGIGCTASLVSDIPKRGPHRIHVAAQCSSKTRTDSLELVKGRRSRAEEEGIATKLLLNMIAKCCDVGKHLELPLVENEAVESHEFTATQEWRDLLVGERSAVELPLQQQSLREGQPHEHQGPRGIFPGAFNPLHHGHIHMAEVAARRIGGPVEFELSIENVDKPPLDFIEIDERAAQFSSSSLPLWLTRAPTFEKKSQLFPGCTFIVGTDTISRIGQCRYYRDDPAAMEAAIAGIAERGCRFLVFDRLANGKLETLSDLQIPASLRRLCDEVPAVEFRDDVSSTELRRKATGD